MTRVPFGAVADDITGACDLADATAEAGAATVVRCGVPGDEPVPPCDVAIVALKSRTAPVDRAVRESQLAAQWLVADALYQKYCSTFDSTDAGNIGPVANALRDERLSVATPATPRAERTVYQGHLFVRRQLLAESPMRHHPLTPMRDSDLVAVLGRQTRNRVGLVPHEVLRRGPDAVRAALDAARADGTAHLLLDALDERDLDLLADAALAAARDEPLLFGGAAGFGAALVRRSGVPKSAAARACPEGTGERRLIVSGSCSARTREQVAAFDGPTLTLSPLDLADDPEATVNDIVHAAERAFCETDAPVLVSSSAGPDEVRVFESTLGSGRAAELLENASGEIARRAVAELGVRRLLVAGGETSGAVVAALGVATLRVGSAAAPGVPWMVPTDDPSLALLLKSGNFGAPDLFGTAWEVCP